MRFQATFAIVSAAAITGAAAQFDRNPANCPDNAKGDLRFTLKTKHANNQGHDYGNLVPVYLPYSPSSSLFNALMPADGALGDSFQLSANSSLSVLTDDPDGSHRPNSGFKITMNPVPGSHPAGIPKLKSGNDDLSSTFYPLLSGDQSPDKFILVSFQGSQILMPQAEGFKQWVVCESDNGRNDPVIAWTDKDLKPEEYGKHCNKVQLYVSGCKEVNNDCDKKMDQYL